MTFVSHCQFHIPEQTNLNSYAPIKTTKYTHFSYSTSDNGNSVTIHLKGKSKSMKLDDDSSDFTITKSSAKSPSYVLYTRRVSKRKLSKVESKVVNDQGSEVAVHFNSK